MGGFDPFLDPGGKLIEFAGLDHELGAKDLDALETAKDGDELDEAGDLDDPRPIEIAPNLPDREPMAGPILKLTLDRVAAGFGGMGNQRRIAWWGVTGGFGGVDVRVHFWFLWAWWYHRSSTQRGLFEGCKASASRGLVLGYFYRKFAALLHGGNNCCAGGTELGWWICFS